MVIDLMRRHGMTKVFANSGSTELPQPYVKFSLEPARAEDVPMALARAYHIAMQEPKGPVFVSIPVDDWDRPAEALPPRQVSTRVRPDPFALAQLRAALDACLRLVFVVGSSIDRAGAFDAVRALAERHHARIFTAPMSVRCAFPEDHRLFAGFLPPMREKIGDLLGGHDLILVIGALGVHVSRGRGRASRARGRYAVPVDRRSRRGRVDAGRRLRRR